jgi:pimeloyl-ACP methyl ester carboxylesterase
MAELIVRSADGTRIQCRIYGLGPPLLIISGALFATELWQRTVPLLSSDRTVYVIERRGRGQSFDSGPYAPTREVEDILAVLAAVGVPLDLLGHSSGAILALEVAACAPQNLERVIAYEPPVFFNVADRISADLPERLDTLLAAGLADSAVELFFREGPRASEAEMQSMRSGSGWALMVKNLAHTVARDARVQRAFSGDEATLARVRARTLLMVGGVSPPRMRHGAEIIRDRVPNARLVELPGQQHVAMLTAPVLFTATVKDFLAGGA